MPEEKTLQIQEAEKQEVADSEAERTRDCPAFVPRADIYEMADAIVVLADMPGVDENSIEITVENNVLTINGYVEPRQYPDHSQAYAEYRVGDYVRAFSLSNQIDRDGIQATVRDGVLRLHLPKQTQARRRQVTVQAR